MNKLRLFIHESKAVLSLAFIIAGLLMMVLAIFGEPTTDGEEGSGPLAFLRGINTIVIIAMAAIVLASFYVFYKFSSDKSKFEGLMNSKSQAIFKKNQIELERFALRLTSKEEKMVLEAIKRYKIR